MLLLLARLTVLCGAANAASPQCLHYRQEHRAPYHRSNGVGTHLRTGSEKLAAKVGWAPGSGPVGGGQVLIGLLGVNASATARVISRR